MHRFILDAAPGTTLDHQNGDGLDNRRANLRYATASQNGGNRRVSLSNKCGFKGVYKPKHTARWNARITHNRKRFRLGYFDTAEDAARAYNEAALRLFGTFARLNPV